MSKADQRVAAGVGIAACAACCAAPIAGALAAIGISTAVAVRFIGVGAVLMGVIATLVLLRRRGRIGQRTPTRHRVAVPVGVSGCETTCTTACNCAVGSSSPG